MSDVRLIDANVLKAVFIRADDDKYYTIEVKNVIDNSPTVETYTKDDMTNEYLKGYNACKDIIQPTGEWIKTDNRWGMGLWRCSYCDSFYDVRTNYCPTCGAKMKREVDNE